MYDTLGLPASAQRPSTWCLHWRAHPRHAHTTAHLHDQHPLWSARVKVLEHPQAQQPRQERVDKSGGDGRCGLGEQRGNKEGCGDQVCADQQVEHLRRSFSLIRVAANCFRCVLSVGRESSSRQWRRCAKSGCIARCSIRADCTSTHHLEADLRQLERGDAAQRAHARQQRKVGAAHGHAPGVAYEPVRGVAQAVCLHDDPDPVRFSNHVILGERVNEFGLAGWSGGEQEGQQVTARKSQAQQRVLNYFT